VRHLAVTARRVSGQRPRRTAAPPRGKVEIRPYVEWGGTQLPEFQFNVLNKIVDDERAAVNWDETGVTKRGEPWTGIGCDFYCVNYGQIVELTVYGDTEKMTLLLEAYPG
jgi:hypothetical protein